MENLMKGSVTCLVLSLLSAAAFAQTPATLPSDYQERMRALNQKAQQQHDAGAQQDVAALREENQKLRLVVTTLLQSLKEQGKWDGPTDPDEILKSPNAGDSAISSAAIAVVVTKKAFHEMDVMAGDAGNSNVISFSITNGGKKTILATKGTLELRDKFGDSVGKFTIKIDDKLPPRSPVTETYSFAYNQFMEADRTLRNTDANGMTAVFDPEVIQFVDGTSWRK